MKEDKEKNEPKRRDKWDNPIEFFLSCVAMSVGLGNVWRFPYIVYTNGGGAFLIPYFIIMFLVGRPFYFVELVVGQFSQSNGAKVWDAVPIFRGVGYVITIYYFFVSFQTILPWTQCYDQFDLNLKEICVPTANTTEEIEEYLNNVGINSSNYKIIGSAEKYYLNNVLRMKEDLSDGLGPPNTGKKLLQPKVWYTAIGQLFFSLSVATSVIPSMASYNDFNHNIYRDAWILAVIDTITSFIAGFAIFSVLGNLSYQLGKPIDEVVTSGTSLAFITYPTAISKFDVVPQLFSVLFFVMLAVLGLGSLIALMNAISILAFISGIIYTTPGGQQALSVIDSYGAILNAYIFGLFQAIGWGYLYGVGKIKRDIKFMLNINIGCYWYLCWGFVCPLLLFGILIYQIIKWEDVEFNGPLPGYLLWMGRVIPIISMIVFLSFMVNTFLNSKVPKDLIRPLDSWGPKDPEIKKGYIKFIKEYDEYPEEETSDDENDIKV
ncbi:Sodium-dependent nutrient amino acid transporter 1 [Lepeophtheirus salmonis]|uniref:Transporter n=1 Tax=Lepeophtheirus salmonis TaxID=72036 RepID=A0A7R8D4Q4_LEPSM|nr:Sodium-dependent nutrient amino acid transporter 1 [Lepeophtheirus salmonis]CAF2974279.1 Sodium-dependent nutrient amino acid transporter 1 [Lepeophtheirus salmonis]